MQNLRNRRSTGVSDNKHCESAVSNYSSHLTKIYVGASLLDVGCGDQQIGKILSTGFWANRVKYVGIDAFPCVPDAIKEEIETCAFPDRSFETVICFAALDNLYDVKTAIINMKRLASYNVAFLTGIDIEPDQYHTVKITHQLLDDAFSDWRSRCQEQLAPKVWLIEYARI